MSFFLTSTVSMFVVLGILVFVHELGHFIVAKLCGVRVEVFSLGFGPRLFGMKRGDTDYRVSLLPFGGYVKMAGEIPGEAQSGDPAEFNARPRWQRVLIALAGPAANFALAIGLMTVFYMMHNEVEAYQSWPARVDFVMAHSPASAAGFAPGDLITDFDGIQNPTWRQISIRTVLDLGHPAPVKVERNHQTVALNITVPNPRDEADFDLETVGFVPQMQKTPISIHQIEANMPAQRAGLKAGDKILSVDGMALHSVDAMISFLQQNGSQPIHLTVSRGGSVFQVLLQPMLGDPGDGHKVYRIGFSADPPPVVVQQLPLPAAFLQSIHFNARNSSLILEFLQRIATRRLSVETISGPVGIARQTGLAVQQPELQPIIGLTAVISINLGIVNLMPFPILDGGTIFLLLIEGVLRRDLNQHFKERIYQAAFVVIILLFVFIMFNDISKLPVFGKLHP
jgi:regulator of sigma E protease